MELNVERNRQGGQWGATLLITDIVYLSDTQHRGLRPGSWTESSYLVGAQSCGRGFESPLYQGGSGQARSNCNAVLGQQSL
jgi:hypothetical protein